MRIIRALFAGLGVAAMVAGACMVLFAITHPGKTYVYGLGPFSGEWEPMDYFFVGGIFLAAGAGVFTVCLWLRKPRAP